MLLTNEQISFTSEILISHTGLFKAVEQFLKFMGDPTDIVDLENLPFKILFKDFSAPNSHRKLRDKGYTKNIVIQSIDNRGFNFTNEKGERAYLLDFFLPEIAPNWFFHVIGHTQDSTYIGDSKESEKMFKAIEYMDTFVEIYHNGKYVEGITIMEWLERQSLNYPMKDQ